MGCSGDENINPDPSKGVSACSQWPALAALSPSKTYYVTLRTNCGDFTVKVNPNTSPNAAASFVSLAQRGFYDSTPALPPTESYAPQDASNYRPGSSDPPST